MTNADTMADNAVRCDSNGTRDSNGTSDSNGMGDSNGMSDSNGMGDSNGSGDGMADNTVADSDSDIRVGSSAVVGDLGNISVDVAGVVVDVLDPSVRQVD